MTLTITKNVYYSQDINQLFNILQEMVGQQCWEARTGYLGIVRLEIGKKVSQNDPKLSRKYRGEWSFASWVSEWQLDNLKGNITNSKEIKGRESEIDQNLKILEGTIISSVEVNQFNFGIRIGFNNGFSLTISPYNLKKPANDVYWMIELPPEQGLLEVGPKLTWSITPRGLPVYDREQGGLGVEDLPKDYKLAQRLAYADPKLFESWILYLLNAKAISSKDKDVDGEITLKDSRKKAQLHVLIQVKIGKLEPKAIEKLNKMVSTKTNSVGLLVSLEEPVLSALELLDSINFVDVPNLGHFPKVRVLTVKDLLEKNITI